MGVPDQRTAEVYDRMAAAWTAARQPGYDDELAWLNEARLDGPLADIGAGPGWHAATLDAPAVALDVAAGMLDLCRSRAPAASPLQASAEDLPFRTHSLGGAISGRVHVHVPTTALPLALADLHRALKPGAPLFLHMFVGDATTEARSKGEFGGRLFSWWTTDHLRHVIVGAGFEIIEWDESEPDADFGLRNSKIKLRAARTLADTIGADMDVLICGLNPSIYSADVGVGFARPGNRFWPAALAAGLVTVDRDPFHALTAHGVGMTDLVKRATARADELSRQEYQTGLARVERLIRWLQPKAVCFVGLAGWRAVIDRKATAGWQPDSLADRPAYVMPSTSGLNAHSRLDDLTLHFETVRNGLKT